MNKKLVLPLFVLLIAAPLAGCATAQPITATPLSTIAQTPSAVATPTSSGGPVKLEFIGHDCFLLTAGDGTRIVMDPYRTSYVPIDISTFPNNLTADLVTMSQLHPDHSGIREVAGNPPGMYQAGVKHIGAVTVTGYTTDQAYFDGSRPGEAG